MGADSRGLTGDQDTSVPIDLEYWSRNVLEWSFCARTDIASAQSGPQVVDVVVMSHIMFDTNSDLPVPERFMSDCIDLIINPREKDLGGFTVRRVLPFHKKRMVGPFIFFDHMGPSQFQPGDGVDVRPHPHIGLATVTYLFDGGLLHRDTEGNELVIEPGAVNWMTAGRGISHSERTPEDLRSNGHRLHGIQTWVALPRAHEDVAPAFIHHPANTLPTFDLGGGAATLIAGKAYGQTSPVEFPHQIFYIAVDAQNGAVFSLPEDIEERSVYVVDGGAVLDGVDLAPGTMAVLRPGGTPEVVASEGTKLMLAGGAPMDGERYIDWNFVSSSKDRITVAIEHWRESAEKWWHDAPFKMPPNENEYIPYPGDEEISPPDD